MRSRARLVITCAVVAAGGLLAAADAQPHGGGRFQGYVSTVSGLQPNVVGVLVTVFGQKNTLQVTNYSRKTIVIFGYEHEPYLRLDGTNVYENTLSPTAHLNALRAVPTSVDPKAHPRWREISRGASYSWHDHRIVWTGAKPPPAVRQAPREPHLIFRWRIPAAADGKPFRISGFLGWAPQPKAGANGRDWVLPAALGTAGAAVLATALALGLRARRARRRAL